MIRILALDLARVTGWAVGSCAQVEGFGIHELVRSDEPGEYGKAARLFFRRILDETEPGLVVYEAPILRSGKIVGNGNRLRVATVDTPAKLRKIYGLPWELEIECYDRNIRVVEANIGATRAHFLMGKVPKGRKECKLAVSVMARRRGWKITDDNDADALAILDYQLAREEPRNWTAPKISAGGSATSSSFGRDAFVGSRRFFPPAIETARPANSENGLAGISSASSTERGSPSEIMATIPPSRGAMTSTLSRSPQRQLSLALKDVPEHFSRR